MAKKCKYTVYLSNDEIAKFSNWQNALDYASEYSFKNTCYTEISNHTGLLAQFNSGELSREFAHLRGEVKVLGGNNG